MEAADWFGGLPCLQTRDSHFTRVFLVFLGMPACSRISFASARPLTVNASCDLSLVKTQAFRYSLADLSSLWLSLKGDFKRGLLHRTVKSTHLVQALPTWALHFTVTDLWLDHNVLCSRHSLTRPCSLCPSFTGVWRHSAN